MNPNTPRYQGRPFAHPDEELTDQGLAFDVVTLLSRRNVLRVMGLGAAAAGLVACGATAGTTDTASGTADTTSTGEIPDETAGPYPGDGSNGPDVLEESGIVRRDIRSSFGTGSATAEGVPMELTLTVLDMQNDDQPMVAAAVYAWHCTADGLYSLYSDGLEDENFLRGVQIADDKGEVTFTSIVPGCYSGRWPHVHFEVYPDEASITDSANAIATSQVALPEDVCNQVYATDGYASSIPNLAGVTLADDNVFGDDDGVLQLGTTTGDTVAGYTVTLTVKVDTATTPTQGNAPADGGGGGGQGGPGGAGGTPPSGGPGGGTPPEGGTPPDGGTQPSGAPSASASSSSAG